MTDARHPTQASFAPARRRWPLALAVLLAFAAGLAVAWWGITRWQGRPRQSGATVTVAAHRLAAPKPIAPPPAVIAAAAPPASPDPALLAARTDLVAAQLADVERRTAAVVADAGSASGQAGRAEAMLLAVAARRAVDRGTGPGAIEEPLRERFGASRPRAVAVTIAAIRTPVTLDSLRTGLDGLGDALLTSGGDEWSRVRQQIAALVIVHRAGTPSPVPAERLAHARRLVDAGAIRPALVEVSHLPGAAAASDWIAAARRYLEAQRALDALDAAAIRGEASPAIVPGPPAAG